MPRPKNSPPRARESQREMASLGGRRRVGIGLATKFTVPVAVTITAVIGIMGLVIHGTSTDALQSQLNQQGVFAARLAAAPELATWRQDHATVADMQSRLLEISAALAVAGASSIADPAIEVPAGSDLAELQARVREADRQQRAANRNRLSRLTRSEKGRVEGALDFWILDSEGQSVARATSGSVKFGRSGKRYSLSSSPNTIIQTGTYELDGKGVFARFFEHPIVAANGRQAGSAVVVFSESQLRENLSALQSQIITFVIIGILAAAIVAFLTSKMVTRPLDHLMHDIQAVAGGDLAHRTRVRSQDEIGALASTFDKMTRNLEAAESMRQNLAAKEHEVELATDVQTRLFPKKLPEAGQLQLSATNRLVGELSADLFDARQLNDGRIGMLVMSSSGTGMPAAIVLSMARSLFRALAPLESGPAGALRAINRELSPDLRRGMYVSAIYAIIDPNTGTGSLASAGHRVPALHYIAESRGLRRLQSDGIAMGLDKGPVFDSALNEHAFELAAGDRLLLASEGAFVMIDAEDQPIDDQAFLKAALAICREGQDLDRLLDHLRDKRGARPGSRDVTIVAAAMQNHG